MQVYYLLAWFEFTVNKYIHVCCAPLEVIIFSCETEQIAIRMRSPPFCLVRYVILAISVAQIYFIAAMASLWVK